MGKQSHLLLKPTEVELGLQDGVEFDNILLIYMGSHEIVPMYQLDMI